MALRISPELPVQSVSNMAWSGTHILPQLCSQLWENILQKTYKASTKMYNKLQGRLSPFLPPGSKCESELSSLWLEPLD